MHVLLFGASGGIGSQVLTRLLVSGVSTTVIVRDADRLPAAASGHKLLTIVVEPRGHLALSDEEMVDHVRGKDVVMSCLGHNLTRKGIWGHPRNLCADTTARVCEAIRGLAPQEPVKFIVVSTEGVDHPAGTDPIRGYGERLILGILAKILPPHLDNMMTVKYLHEHVSSGTNPFVSFCAVRPSDLRDDPLVSHASGDMDHAPRYTLHENLQNGIFKPGTSTRANVGQFMHDLATQPEVWAHWEGKYPQILDKVVAPKHEVHDR